MPSELFRRHFADKDKVENMPGMLIVRPAERAGHDARICLEAGWAVRVFSPIEIEPDETALQQLPEQYRLADAVFWVSPTAVETAAPYLDMSDNAKTHIAVGQASRRVLSGLAVGKVCAPEQGNDSEAVLRLPVWDTLPEAARVLIVRGHGGRDFLMHSLQAQGFCTDIAEVYFRRHIALNWQDFSSEGIDAAYITSSEWVAALFRQIPPRFSRFFKSLLYFTHHPRIAEALRREGAERIHIVPSIEAALECGILTAPSATPMQTAAFARSNTKGAKR